MIKRECVKHDEITTCQIPYDKNGLVQGIEFVALIAMVFFGIHLFIRVLGRFIR